MLVRALFFNDFAKKGKIIYKKGEKKKIQKYEEKNSTFFGFGNKIFKGLVKILEIFFFNFL